MLPSTGLFKSVLCPYYDTTESRCLRPYCHYKHATKKDDEPEQPVYIPTQKIEPPKLLTLGEPLKKKSKLEYIPTKPQINDAPQTKNYSANSDNVPVYIPSNKININLNNIKDIDLDDCAEELNMISEVISAEFSDIEDDNIENINNDDNNSIIKLDNQIVEDEKRTILNNNNQKIDIQFEKETKIITKDKNNYKSNCNHSSSSIKKDRHRSTSSSSSSKHKTKTKSEKDSDKDHKYSNRKSTKHTSSSSSSSKTKPTSSHHSSKSSHKSSTKEKHSSRHKSSSSSSKSSSSKSKSSNSKDENKEISKITVEPKLLPSVDLKIESSDEEDIEAQCKLIFEQFKPKTIESTTSQPAENSNKEIQKRKSSTEIDDASIDDVSKKKRIAHENLNNYVKCKPDITPLNRPNHVQNAVRSVYDRQDKAKKDLDEQKAAALAQYRDAQEKLKEAAENLLKTDKLTPLVPKSHLIPSKPSFLMKPLSNFIALERAKKKVEEMNKEKGPTLAQSIIKGTGRIAHRPPILPATITKNNSTNLINNDTKTKEIVNRPAPPVLESKSTKISYNIRMQNYNTMVKYCLDIYPICEDAWERAQTEELAVFKKCSTPNIYRSSAIMTVNKLRKESIAAGNVCTDKNKTISHELILAGKAAQNVSWGVKKNNSLSNNSSDPFDRLPGSKIYELIADLILNEEQLVENGFPRTGKRRGNAIIQGLKTAKPIRNDERFCQRCSKIFNLSMYDTDAIDECNYHPKGTGYRRGFVDHFHRCCQQPAGTPGCTYGNYHVSNYIDPDNLTGFVTTIDKDANYCPTKKDIFALDCEMCYTTNGIELTRITVVDFDGKVVYDALVKPDNKIVDYNTTYSGITEKLLENVTRTIRDVQAVLLSMFHSKSILIGHSLESDLKTLKLIHSVVVDTSVLYPHKMGPPKKRALKTLCIENLKRIIQEDESGHNSAEDAEVCIQLVKYYLRNRLV